MRSRLVAIHCLCPLRYTSLFGFPRCAYFLQGIRWKKNKDKPVNSLQRKGFPICPYYAIRAYLRVIAFEERRLYEGDSGVAWTQQFLHDRKYLCASGYGGKRLLRCEADWCAPHPSQRSDQHLALAPVLSGRRELRRELAREQGNTRLPEIRETEYFQVVRMFLQHF